MELRRRFISVIILLSLTVCLAFIPSFEGATQYAVNDTKSGDFYTITESDNEITITDDNTQFSFYIDSMIVDICCFDGVFTFLCATEATPDNFVYTVYTYNSKNSSLSSFGTDIKAARNKSIFAANNTGGVYILNYSDSTIIECYENGVKCESVICNSSISQMMCTETDSVLIFTVDGVYLLKNHSISKLSSLVPVFPCRYAGEGIIIDNTGNRFIYNNGSFNLYKEESTYASEVQENNDNVTVNFDDKYISLAQSMTIAKFLDVTGYNKSDITFKKADGSTVASGKLCTGMKVIAENTTHIIIVKGDLTGEGNINSRDLKAIMKHLTEEEVLSASFEKAADLDDDNIITTKDMLALARLY